jgi:hypothetical protein
VIPKVDTSTSGRSFQFVLYSIDVMIDAKLRAPRSGAAGRQCLKRKFLIDLGDELEFSAPARRGSIIGGRPDEAAPRVQTKIKSICIIFNPMEQELSGRIVILGYR